MTGEVTVTLSILDKQYQIACKAEEQADLISASQYLDKQMRSIRSSGKTVGLERIAVMAAINVSYELQCQMKTEEGPDFSAKDSTEEAFLKLKRKVDEALYNLRQLEIG